VLETGPSGAPVLVAAQPVARVLPAREPGELLGRWLVEAVSDDRPAGATLQPRLLRLSDGRLLPLDVDRWAGPVTAADESLLARAQGPVLDVGCGPGRLTAALHRRGVAVLGLDVLEPVPVLAHRAGAPVHLASVFDRLPGEGTWGTVLLADGNVGIGGDVLVELDASARGRGASRVRLEGLGCASEWFSWSLLGPDGLPDVAHEAGLDVQESWDSGGRLFAALS
jgi:SAM-dependent methyltransferase